MRGVVGKIGEKWFVLFGGRFHEVHGRAGEVIDAKSFAGNDPPVFLQHGIEVVSPVAAAETVKEIKAAAVRVVGKLHPVVPFPESPGGVAIFLEELCDGGFVEIHSLASGRGGIDIGAHKIASGKKLGPGWGANGADEEVIEARAILGQRIDVRGA